MPDEDLSASLAAQAKFVFQGTVLKLKASNLSEVADKSDSIVVRVDRVIQSPPVTQNYAGQEVTVKLSDGESVKAGESAVFYTNGWIVGQTGIAVKSIGHMAAAPAHLSSGATPHDKLKDQELQNRLSTADMVVSGKVSSINLPDSVASGPATLGATTTDRTPGRTPISEHEPEWRDAVVEVADTHKGEAAKKVVIRFPSSNDVRWYRAPKFYPGQEGVFILHKARPASDKNALHKATVTAGEAGSADAYTALHPADFQPIQRHAEIKTMMTGMIEPGQK